MMAMLRSALFVLGLAACATAPQRSTDRAAVDRHGESCSLDTECPGGSCRAGVCSWVVAAEPERDVCAVEVQCYGGSGACRNGGICARWAPSFGPQQR